MKQQIVPHIEKYETTQLLNNTTNSEKRIEETSPLYLPHKAR